MIARPLTEREHALLVDFHAQSVSVARTERCADPVSAEEWARIEAEYRARATQLGDAYGRDHAQTIHSAHQGGNASMERRRIRDAAERWPALDEEVSR